jgi:CheY-like chemotaxis protein
MLVMIVDDDPDDIALYCELFVAINPDIVVKTFLQAPNALSCLRRQKLLPDLIILDLDMPEMGGLDFLRQVRADKVLKWINVVVVTTTCTNGNTEAVLALRAACLRKQTRFEDFKILITRLLKETRNRQHDLKNIEE